MTAVIDPNRMHARWAMVVAFAFGPSAIGCSLLTSLDGLSGAAGVSDASGIADALDASVSSIDAGAAESEASPCAGAILCDDFERDDVVGAKWAGSFTSNGGALRIDSTTATSPSRSLAAFVPASGDPHTQLTSVAYPAVSHVRVAFSMKSPTPDREMSLLRLQLTSGDLSPVLDVFMQQSMMVASEQGLGATRGPYASYSVMAQFKPDTWQQWSVELDARSGIAIGIVTIDGVEVVHKTLTNTYRPGLLTLIVGMFYANNGPAHVVSYDDVVLTILP